MELSKDCFIAMNDCNHILLMAFGPMAPEDIPKANVKEATKAAIDAGFRQIDSAFVYDNEVEIGEAIQEKISDGTVKREDIFYTGKLWSTFHTPDLVRPALEKSLKALKLDYIDLYLIQMPISLKPGDDLIPMDENGKWIYHEVDLRETWQVFPREQRFALRWNCDSRLQPVAYRKYFSYTWKPEAMEECKEAGLVKSIGVSNFNKKQLELILNKPGLKFEPAVNQVECHVYLNQEKLLDFCNSKDIVLEAYCVFGSTAKDDKADKDDKGADESADKTKKSALLEDPVLVKMGEKYKKSPAQVSIRYLLQRGIVVLSASSSPESIKQNFEVYDFCLDPDDMKALDGLNKNQRYADLKLGADHPQYPFKDEV